MSEQQNGHSDRLCKEKHDNLEKYNQMQDRRINNHSDRIDKLEQFQAGVTVEIRELCIQIKSLVATVRWGTGLIIVTLVGFFIWYVQRL